MAPLDNDGPSGADERPPMAVAMEWVSQITTVVLEMILPGLAGQWLDGKWGTKFLALAGFAIGLTIAIRHLLFMTEARSRRGKNGTSADAGRKTAEATQAELRRAEGGDGNQPPPPTRAGG